MRAGRRPERGARGRRFSRFIQRICLWWHERGAGATQSAVSVYQKEKAPVGAFASFWVKVPEVQLLAFGHFNRLHARSEPGERHVHDDQLFRCQRGANADRGGCARAKFSHFSCGKAHA